MPDQIDLGAMFLEKMIEVPSTMTHEQNDPPWNPDQAILIWQHFANVGGADKDRMVTVSTWLLSFSGTIIGYIAIQEWGGTESNPLVAIILAFLGVLVSSLALAIITIYASYSNWNWGMADAIAKRYGWYDLYMNERLQLGLIWENETLSVFLAGNLARFEARAVVIDAQISPFRTVDLAFAWTQAPNVPLILGQANFFFEFDVCFFRARSEFEVRPKQFGSDR